MAGKLAATLKQVLLKTEVNAAAVVLEITEDTSVWDTAASVDTLTGLRALGIEIALDDFGTVYSSFNHRYGERSLRIKFSKDYAGASQQFRDEGHGRGYRVTRAVSLISSVGWYFRAGVLTGEADAGGTSREKIGN